MVMRSLCKFPRYARLIARDVTHTKLIRFPSIRKARKALLLREEEDTMLNRQVMEVRRNLFLKRKQKQPKKSPLSILQMLNYTKRFECTACKAKRVIPIKRYAAQIAKNRKTKKN